MEKLQLTYLITIASLMFEKSLSHVITFPPFRRATTIYPLNKTLVLTL